MAEKNEEIKQLLSEAFPEKITEWEEPYALLTFKVPSADILKVIQFLYDDDRAAYRFLTDLTVVHFPERTGEEFCMVYHMYNMRTRHRLRIKSYLPVDNPSIFTLTSLFPAANWQEREAYDFFGIKFIGHPNLKRIMNVEEMDYFPMRKEYPLEDQLRTDKDDDMFGRGGQLLANI